MKEKKRNQNVIVIVNICSFFSRYVLNAYEYDDTMFQGPPRNLPRDEVFNLFGKCPRVFKVSLS